MINITKIKIPYQMKHILVILSVCIGMISCFEAPKYSDIPKIAYKGFEMAGSTVQNGENLILNFSFEDGDGDLGLLNSTDTTRNFFITLHSQYFSISDTFSIPNIPTSGSVNDISGIIRFNMISYYNVICNPFAVSTYDTCSFDLFVKDRAGNVSNTITTDKVVFQCR